LTPPLPPHIMLPSQHPITLNHPTDTMQITLNGQPHDLPDNTTVAQFLQWLNLKPPYAVERNKTLCPRAQHETTTLQPGDILEVVTIVGGG